ncbi:MAG: hypothetical protein KGL43_20485 [Burkholderiales bacterium]|nr:hypothetical protein [Burkholderiales bacterium]MDE2455975.1 hypothetical protein [Burkholderiales bacterium]
MTRSALDRLAPHRFACVACFSADAEEQAAKAAFDRKGARATKTPSKASTRILKTR